jgi:hypothetical protein
MLRHLAVVSCCLCTFTAGAIGQNSEFRIGLGASVYPAVNASNTTVPFVEYSLASLSVPVQVGSIFRLEPEFGILRVSYSREWDGLTLKETSTCYRLALLLAYQIPHLAGCENVSGYIGPRIGLLPLSRSESDYDGTETTVTQHGYLVGLASGGEYFLAKAFSLGGEVSVNLQTYGRQSDETFYTDETMSFLTVSTKVSVRWYFN